MRFGAHFARHTEIGLKLKLDVRLAQNERRWRPTDQAGAVQNGRRTPGSLTQWLGHLF
jgi:hypothetical protein